VNGAVTSIALKNNNLYAGGLFGIAGGAAANYIARWNGTGWSALGSGVSGALYNQVNALEIVGDSVFVGGNFTRAGQKFSYNFAIWNLPKFEVKIGLLPNGSRQITWNSESNQTYQVYSSPSLSQQFTPLSGPIASGGLATSYTDSASPSAHQFYEIILLP
jgi:hypothetical protein